MPSRAAFPGWCAVCRRAALGALAVGILVSAAPGQAAPATPATIRFASDTIGTGLDQPGRVVQDLAVQRRSLAVLQAREQARRATTAAPAPSPSATAVPTPAAPAVPAGPAPTLGGQAPLSAPQAVSVAIGYALAQVGKPYVWGATGPDSYDCSGLVQRSYAVAGVALPRTSREQARVGTPVELADLLPGDLLFWAYDPSDLSTVHHVAMYLGDGRIVQAPQPGEYVEVTSLWLTGFAGAVRVATGPADTTLPAVPPGVPGTGLTPAGDAMPDGSPPPDDGSLPPTTLPPTTLPPGTPGAPGPTAPATTAPATPAPGTTAPGTTAPGTTAPGAPGTTAPGTTAPATTAPGTTAPGTSAPGTTAPGTTAPGTTAPGTTAPGTTAPGTNPPTGSGTTAPGTTAPGTTAPGTTPPAPAPSTTPPPPAPETTSPAAAPTSAAAATSSAATAAPSSTGPASASADAADAATPTATPTSTP